MVGLLLGGVRTPLWFIDSRQDDILVSSHDECFQGTEPRPAINLSGEHLHEIFPSSQSRCPERQHASPDSLLRAAIKHVIWRR